MPCVLVAEVDWLILHCLRIDEDDLIAAMFAAHVLCSVHEEERLEREERKRLSTLLLSRLLFFTPTPVGLGSGHKDVVSKAVAATHSYGLSCDDLESLSQWLRSFSSYTTDMGTEMSLTSVRLPSIRDFAPPWLHRLAIDGEDCQAPSPPPREDCQAPPRPLLGDPFLIL